MKARASIKTNTAVLNALVNDLPCINDEFPCINLGGCGVMVVIIAEELDALHVKYRIVCTYGYSCDRITEKEVNSRIRANYKIPNYHILIQVQGRIFDSEEEMHLQESEIAALVGIDTIRNMLKVDIWNPEFDRDDAEGMKEYTHEIFQALVHELA